MKGLRTGAHGQARRSLEQLDEIRYRLWSRRLSSPARLERPIFVVGAPRSGTSTFVALLGSHPSVANWSEAGRVWDPRSYDDPEADHEWGRDRATDAEAQRLHARFEHFRVSRHRERFVNKHPRSSVRIGFINAVFPDAFFVHLVRDGRAVAHSIVSKIRREPYRQAVPFGCFCKPPGWRGLVCEDPLEQAGVQWREIVACVRAHRAELGNRYLEVAYEDLCANPRGTVSRVFEFAGLPTGSRAMAAIPDVLEDMNGKYRAALSREEIDVLERVEGDLLRAIGYPLPG